MNPSVQRTFANQRASTPARGIARDETFRTEIDENAPPTPSVEDDIPAANNRMIGALANSRASTPLTISGLQTPTRQNLQLRSGASTLAGSVVDAPISTTTPVRNRILFRADPNMLTTFDKKADGELYDLWNA